MQKPVLVQLASRVADLSSARPVGRVVSTDGHTVQVSGLESDARLGDRLRLVRADGAELHGDVLRLSPDGVTMLPDSPPRQVALADRVTLLGPVRISPDDAWVGRVIDPYGQPLDGRPIPQGVARLSLDNPPPPPATRQAMGPRLRTGFHLFNTLLPIAQGQRVGIFAGAGVGKTTLLGDLVRSMEADLVVIALVGERGREINHFTQKILGQSGLARTIVVAASADSAPTSRMRCAISAMRIAEHFRDRGMHVLLFVDSLTRFSEAQREVAVSAGEFPSLRGFPPSTPSQMTALLERAGPSDTGAITAVCTVLVAASDMNEPVADMLRGILDGHVLLDRKIADQGRFPAVNVLQSVSRCLPDLAEPKEVETIAQARRLIATYDAASGLIESGLYASGSDLDVDRAIAFRKAFIEFSTIRANCELSESFEALRLCIRRSESTKEARSRP